MYVTFNYNHYEFWEVYNPPLGTFGPQKVTFDGVNSIILINSGERIINVLEDIYSAWKEWTLVLDNSKYAQALSAVGGDPITNTRSVGVTYFLENGWRLQPASENHILEIIGNLYTREPGEDPFLEVEGNYKVTISLTRSNIIDQIGQGVGPPCDCPTAEEVADAVRTELTPELTQIDNIDTNVQLIDAKVDLLTSLLNTVDTKVDSIINGIALIQVDLTAMLTLLNQVRKYNSNRTRIDPIYKTLTIYDDDGITPYAIFALKNENGVASVDCVFERDPL